MFVKFRCFGCGSHTIHSNKLNRDFQRVRLIGMIIDGKGVESPATADMGFDGSLPFQPASMEEIWLDVTEATSRNAMLELTFKSVEKGVAPSSARELKH